jgi:hypothetical protein
MIRSGILVRIVPAFVICGIGLAWISAAQAADAPPAPAAAPPAAPPTDTITANYLLQCQRDPNACQVFTNNELRPLVQARKACVALPVNREQTNQLVEWILARPQQASGHATDDIAMASGALWPCR